MKSLYKDTHVELPVGPIKKENHTKRDRSSNIVLGYSNPELKTESQNKYIVIFFHNILASLTSTVFIRLLWKKDLGKI